MRVVSLVPSLTEAVAALGAGGCLVGVTRYCTLGAPPAAARIGGTKNPSVREILALAPDLVLANEEENRRAEVEALRAAGVEVHCSFPRAVSDVGPLLRDLAAVLGAAPAAADRLVRALDSAMARAVARRPQPAVACLTPIWRKPWMAAGRGTFVDDLLGRAGFVNVVGDDGYPRLDAAPPGAAVVLLPSEPYAFGPGDLEPLRAWAGAVAHRFVDGRLLTWHGPSTAQALDAFTDLARALRRERVG
jgi:ABC-type hemin transport system substrate-binding protein